MYDSVSQEMVMFNMWKGTGSFSMGNLWLVEDSGMVQDSCNGSLVFVWNYANSYDDVSGAATVIVNKTQPLRIQDEMVDIYEIHVILPGKDDLFYETILWGDNQFFENVVSLE